MLHSGDHHEDKTPHGSAKHVVAKQFELGGKDMDTPKYKLTKILPQTGQQFVSLGVNASQEVVFEIPTKVHNMAESILSWTRSVADQGAGNFSWIPQTTIPELYQIQLYSRGSLMIVDLREANVYLKVISAKETKMSDVFDRDSSDALLYKSNLPVAQNPRPVAANGSLNSNQNYTEQQHLSVSNIGVGGAAAANSGSQDQLVQLKLKYFLNTVLGLDKDIVWPEVMCLRCVFQASRIGWLGTSNVDPTTGAAALASGAFNTASPATGNTAVCYISGLCLYLAVETRKDVVAKKIAEVSKGVKYIIPFTFSDKGNRTGTSQVLSTKIDSNNGMFLRKAIWSVFGAESVNTMYDHSNAPAAAQTQFSDYVGAKISTFHTEVDNERQQEFDFRAIASPATGTSSDYVEMKKQLRGSAIEGRDQFYYNWMWCDSWLPESPTDGMQPAEALGGLSLSTQRKLDFVVTNCQTVNSNNIYAFFVCTRELHISPTLINIK